MNHLNGYDNKFGSGSFRCAAARPADHWAAAPDSWPRGPRTGGGRLGRDREFGPIRLRKIENPL
jgi:hypothetical protein